MNGRQPVSDNDDVLKGALVLRFTAPSVLALVLAVPHGSHDAATQSPASVEAIALEDFEDDVPGDFPREWEARGWGDVKEKPYRVGEENGNRFLRAEDTGQNVVLFKRFRWDIRKYPFIAWRWRIRAVPEGADERYERWADSAAGLYLSYRKKLGLVPQSIKFVWSTSLPQGSAFRRSGIGMPWIIVAGSGTDTLNAWQAFVFDALESYRQTFGGDPRDRPLGVGILSDANNTGTRAFADYDDILALSEAQSPLRIRQFLAVEEVLGERSRGQRERARPD